ncbi:O-antigen ligase family protein [Altererythrobacter sp.]|nr:O-antigen ligase family protein [Altererythrobacter sp.]
MTNSPSRFTFRGAGLNFGLLVIFLAVLFIAGGASRADALGQFVVRAAAWLVLIVVAFRLAPEALRGVAHIGFFLIASAIAVFLQLIPLPPAIWLALPGREILVAAAEAAGGGQPWRPLSMSPDATVNALSSLVVPFAALGLLSTFGVKEHFRIVSLLLALATLSAVIAMIQFSGVPVGNPFVNGDPAWVRGMFANRNHFAVFIAIGCLLACAWAFQDDLLQRWKVMVLIGLLIFFVTVILATGSRAGIVAGGLAIFLGVFLVHDKLGRWFKLGSPTIIAITVGVLGFAISLSLVFDRAISIDRAIGMEGQGGLRGQSLPVIIAMLKGYFPVGTGFGTFDPVYRISEPSELLSTAYLNRAHNDFLEVMLDGGVLGLLLIAALLYFFVTRSLKAWKGRLTPENMLPRLGSLIFLIIACASLVDYPARTPMFMTILVIAAVWLSGTPRNSGPRHQSK